MKPDPETATTGQILGYVARNPRLWSSFAHLVVKLTAAKVRFYLACWSHGYTVREVRQLGEDAEADLHSSG